MELSALSSVMCFGRERYAFARRLPRLNHSYGDCYYYTVVLLNTAAAFLLSNIFSQGYKYCVIQYIINNIPYPSKDNGRTAVGG